MVKLEMRPFIGVLGTVVVVTLSGNVGRSLVEQQPKAFFWISSESNHEEQWNTRTDLLIQRTPCNVSSLRKRHLQSIEDVSSVESPHFHEALLANENCLWSSVAVHSRNQNENNRILTIYQKKPKWATKTNSYHKQADLPLAIVHCESEFWSVICADNIE